MPIDYIDGKSHKLELKAAGIIQPIIPSQNHTTSYLRPRGWTHICMKVISRRPWLRVRIRMRTFKFYLYGHVL